jgi:gluconokinase
MQYIIGCDIGTTNVKTTAFDVRTGAILASHSAGYEMFHKHADWSEQHPDEIFEAVCTAVAAVVKRCLRHGTVLGVSFSSAMHSVLAVSQNGALLSDLIIWADNRSSEIAGALRSSAEGQSMYQQNGTPIHAMTPACKLIWLRKNEPEIFTKAFKFIGIKEYVIYKLTGQFVVDYSIASATGMFDIREKKWNSRTLRYIGLAEESLSTAVSPYHIEKLPGDNRFGLAAGTPLVMGGSDGCLANLGSGAISASSVAVTIGTSAATRICSRNAYTDAQMRTFCYILDESTYVIGGASNNGGVVFEWLKNTFFKELSYDSVFQQAKEVAAGADHLIFFPYLLGERAPLWSSTVRGGFSGVDIQHTSGHFVRAVMEGVLLNLFSVGQILLQQNDITTIFANGGFAQSSIWVQMLADVFGKPVSLNDTVDTGTVGAAMVGLRAIGVYDDFSEMDFFTPVSVRFQPDQEKHKIYQSVFEKFSEQNVVFGSFS